MPKAAVPAPGSHQVRSLIEREVERRRLQLQIEQHQSGPGQEQGQGQGAGQEGACDGGPASCGSRSSSSADAAGDQTAGGSVHEAKDLYRHVFRDLVLAMRDIKYRGGAGQQQGDIAGDGSSSGNTGSKAGSTRRSLFSSPSQTPSDDESAVERGPTSLSQYLSNTGAIGEVSPSSGGVIIPVYFNSYASSTGQYLYGRSFESTSCFKWKYTDQLKLVQVRGLHP